MANRAPTLTGFGPSVTTLEQSVPILLDGDVVFTDPDNNFAGGKLTLTGLLAQDIATVRNEGSTAGLIGVSGFDITYGGVTIGTYSGGNGIDFQVLFNAAASSTAIDALIQNLQYTNTSDTPTLNHSLRLNVIDAAGVGTNVAGTQQSFSSTEVATPYQQPAALSYGSTGATFVDLDGDGDQDFFSTDTNLQVAYYRNDGGTIVKVDLGITNERYSQVTVGDVDGDGSLDLLVGGYYGKLRYFHNNGTSNLVPQFTERTGAANPFPVRIANSYVSSPILVDLDADGDLDLVVARFDSFNNGAKFVTYRNDGTPTIPSYVQVDPAPFASFAPVGFGNVNMAFIDIDNDGDLDMVFTSQSNSRLRLAINNGGTFTEGSNALTQQVFGAANSIDFLDMDGDGRQDLVLGYDNGFKTYLNNTVGGTSFTVTVAAVNDAPSGIDGTRAVDDNLPSVLNAANFGFIDLDGNAPLAVVFTTVPTLGTILYDADGTGPGAAVAVVAGQAISIAEINAGHLFYQAAPGAVAGAGYASVTFQVQDTGGTANGGVDTDPTPNTLTFDIVPDNNAPSGTDKTLTTAEDTTITLALADFGYSDIDGNALLNVRIATLPGAGSLRLNGNAVATGAVISAANIASGLLTYVPTANANGTGYATFTFQVQDNGGTAGTGVDTDQTPNTITIDVTAVNDAPTAIVAEPRAALTGEFLVNTIVAGAQTASTSTALTGGNFVVVWSDASNTAPDTSGGSAIRAQVVTANGLKVGAEFLVNSAFAGAQNAQQVTALKNGGFVITWVDASGGSTANGGAGGDSSSSAIKAQVYTAVGARIGGEFLVNTAVFSAQTVPRITTLTNGFVITWVDASAINGGIGAPGDTSGTAIKAQVYTNDGVRSGGEFLVNTAVTNSQGVPQITALVGGGFVVTWADSSLTSPDTSSTATRAQVFNADGSKSGNEILVNTVTNLAQTGPQIAALAGGGFAIAFTDQSNTAPDTSGNSAVRVQAFTATGAKSGVEMLANTAVNNVQNAQQITALSNGGFVVTWVDGSIGIGGATGDNNGNAIKAQVFAANGAKIGGEVLVNTTIAGSQSVPQIIALPNGKFFISWTDPNGAIDTRAQLFASDGTKLGAELAVNTVTTGAQNASHLAADALGNVLVTWTDTSLVGGDNSSSGIKGRVFSTGLQVLEQSTLDLKGAFTVTDIDVGTGSVTATVSVSGGVLNATAGNSGATVSGSGGTAITVTGTLAQVQAYLGTASTSTLGFSNASDTPPAASVTLSINDGGNSGAGGALTAIVTAPIVITNVNDAPVGTDSAIGVSHGTPRVLSVADFPFTDAESNALLSVKIVTLPTVGTLTYDADGSGPGAAVPVTANQVITATDIAAGKLVYTPTPGASDQGIGSLTFVVRDNGGTLNGGVDTDPTPNTLTFSTAPDIAPSGTDTTLTTAEDTALVFTTASFGFTDTDGNALLSVKISTLPGAGTLFLDADGSGPGTAVAVTAGQTIAIADIAAGNLTFVPDANANGLGYASFTFQVQDNGGTANGGVDLDPTPNTLTITVTAVDDPATAVNDYAIAVENAPAIIAVLANDTDIDGGPKTLISINGVTLAAGQSTTLASGAVVTLNGDGTLGYDPHGNFDYLTAQSSTVDTFGYTLNGGSAATVSVTVTGVTGAGDANHGSANNDVIVGSGYIDASQGGDDIVTGSAANDGFYFGAAFTGADRVDGGAGTNDQIGLTGDYTGGNAIVLQAASITGVEVIAAQTGFSYDITTVDANVATGQTLTIYGSGLAAGNNLTFNGAAETDGMFRIYGGYGADTIVTGAGNDGIYFGAGRFDTATDHVDGGAGANDQMALDGSYTVTIARANVVNVEVLALLDGQAAPANYAITLADDWTTTGEAHTVYAVGVRNAVSVDAHLETDAALKFYGGRGNDVLVGGADTTSGSNWFDGGAGADTLTGGARVDTFFYGSAANSSGIGHDTIVNFDATMDKIDLPFTVLAGGIDAPVTGSLSAASFDQDLKAALSTLDAHHAVQFTANGGDLAGHVFEVIDANNIAGYQAGEDYVMELTNTSGGSGFGAVNGSITDVGVFV